MDEWREQERGLSKVYLKVHGREQLKVHKRESL